MRPGETTRAPYSYSLHHVATDVPQRRLAAAVIQAAIVDHDLAFLASDDALMWCGLLTPEGRDVGDVRARALELAERKRRSW